MNVMDELRNPEYTGVNRCTPCTVLNVGIASAVSLVLAAVNVPLAVIAAVAMLLAIYLRGYLVPGTPTITKRYFPDWFLGYFDHYESGPEADADFDAETLLLGAGALVEDETGSDLQLDPEFEADWYDEYETAEEQAVDTELLASLLDLEEHRLDIEWHGDAFTANLDDQWIGQWESRVAFVADIAADAVLQDRLPGWESYSLTDRSEVLGSLRLFIDRCPDCGDSVAMEQEVKESCCREIDVIATICQGCGERLFEAEFDPTAMAG